MSALYSHAAALVVGALLAVTVQNWRHERDLAQIQSEADAARAHAAEWVIEQSRIVADTDQNATRIVTDANREIDELRDCIERGTGCGLRVKVIRTACVPSADTAPGVGVGNVESAELDPAARRAYYTLRQRIPVIEQALRVCLSATQPTK